MEGSLSFECWGMKRKKAWRLVQLLICFMYLVRNNNNNNVFYVDYLNLTHSVIPELSIFSLRNCQYVMNIYFSFLFSAGFFCRWFILLWRTCELLLDEKLYMEFYQCALVFYQTNG